MPQLHRYKRFFGFFFLCFCLMIQNVPLLRSNLKRCIDYFLLICLASSFLFVFTRVLAVNVDLHSTASGSQHIKQISRYPHYPRKSFPMHKMGHRTPSARSAHLHVSIDFVLSSLHAVDEIIGRFLYLTMVLLDPSSQFSVMQSINNGGRGRVPYELDLYKWDLPLRPAPMVHRGADHTVIWIMQKLLS